jgi:hypothetical protein
MTKAQLLNVLRCVEWAATTKGQPSGMGFDNGVTLAVCPYCHGPKPTPQSLLEFTRIGHTRSCVLDRALREGGRE